MNLSIKNVPDDVVRRLRRRAERNHRSLQGELSVIVEAAAREAQPVDVYAILADVRKIGLKTPSESAAIIREDRDRDER